MQASSGRFCLLGVLLGGLRKKRDFLSSPFNVGYLGVILCRHAYLFSLYLHLYGLNSYGLNSFSYFSAKQWNALPDFFRTSFFADFKTKIQDFTFM